MIDLVRRRARAGLVLLGAGVDACSTTTEIPVSSKADPVLQRAVSHAVGRRAGASRLRVGHNRAHAAGDLVRDGRSIAVGRAMTGHRRLREGGT